MPALPNTKGEPMPTKPPSRSLRDVLHRWRRNAPETLAARAAIGRLAPAVVVTGGSAGVGLAIGKRFLAAGHQVLLVARDADILKAARETLPRDAQQRCFTLAGDVTRPDAAAQIELILRDHGLYMDVLINNAAVGLSGPFSDQTAADLDGLIALNIATLTRLTHHALAAMSARRQGAVLNVASLGGYGPGPNQAAYYASKAYVLSLSEAIASEESASGITVSCLAPGPIATAFHADMGAADARYRTLLPELSADRVAASAYRGLKLGRRVIVPGVFNRLLFLALRLMPHPLSVPITGWLLNHPERR